MTTTSEKRLQKLKERLATISDVNAAEATLHWDRQTYMPDGGVAGRAEQVATLAASPTRCSPPKKRGGS